MAQFLFEHPTLVADAGLHTGTIRSTAVERAGTFVVTGSEDKTVRIWSVTNGELLRTVRMPAGPGPAGKVYSVALSPDGQLIASGGWTSGVAGEEAVYVFDQLGCLVKQLSGLPDVTLKLAFSENGRFLAVALGDYSLRVYDRNQEWVEVFCSSDYGDEVYGLAFSADGHLAATCYDAKIRLYSPDFELVVPPKAVMLGERPHDIEFSPTHNVLAVGYADAAAVEFLDGDSLETMDVVSSGAISNFLPRVGWAKDGERLFAGGEGKTVFSWNRVNGEQSQLLCGTKGRLTSLHCLSDGGLLITTDDTLIKRIDRDGRDTWTKGASRGELGIGNLAVSCDGTIIDFAFDDSGNARRRFDLSIPNLIIDPPKDLRTLLPKQDDRRIERRPGKFLVDGTVISLDESEWPRMWAMSHDGCRFVFAGKWTIRGRDANLKPLWRRDGPGSVWAVNITGNNRFVIAAYDDGTIRWHEMDSGRELLALMLLPSSDEENWVAWTPEGYYATTVGAVGVLQWHINQPQAMSRTVRASDVRKLNLPEALLLTLQAGGVGALAIRHANAARKEVQRVTGSIKAPGMRLHLLAIGVSQYDTAKNLALKFAAKDAMDVVTLIVKTQNIQGPYRGSGGLYADVKPRLLLDAAASKKEIFKALAALQRGIARDDTAIIMFAGHGMMIAGEFYLLPSDVDVTEGPTTIKASAISAIELQKEIEPIAHLGRVLVLLDACHSGAFAFDNSMRPNADVLLREMMASGNLTVLTSSRGTQTSREDESWQNGAFTKVFLEALSTAGADTDHNGVITMNELSGYLFDNLPMVSDGAQEPGIFLSFQNDLFVTGLSAAEVKPTL